MRPRAPLHRILTLRPLRPPNANRLFTQNKFPRLRPQVPFLTHRRGPRHPTRPPARFLSTENKKYLKDSAIYTVKYGSYLYAICYLIWIMLYGVQQEYWERNYPTPPDWSFRSREALREWRWKEENDVPQSWDTKWDKIANAFRKLIERLEDPKIDGADLKEQADGGILVEGIGKMGYDITAKSKAWRQGYHEALMAMARAAERMDGWVVDESRNLYFPANTVIGPSNPNRQPVPRYRPLAPLEENCKVACEGPEVYYMRILTTTGFTPKQKLEAALGYGLWLDYKRTPSAAAEMYKWALDIALGSTPYAANPSQILDPESYTLKPGLGSEASSINSNVLRATTAVAVHYARNGETSKALPIFLSVLRARRSLPEEPETMRDTLIPDEPDSPPGVLENFRNALEGALRALINAPKYPLDEDDGSEAPIRDSKNKCEEAGIMAYIGEVLFAAAPTSDEKATMKAREDGLAWTREAVDIAEEEWRGKASRPQNEDAKRVCKQCLETGLENWQQMINILVAEEKEKAEKAKADTPKRWFVWTGVNNVEMVGRWESEDKVVKERIRRAKEIVEKAEISDMMMSLDKNYMGGVFRGWLFP